MKAATALVAGLALLIVVAPAASAAPAASRARDPIGVLIPKYPGKGLPARGGTVTSLNWSGYEVSASAIKSVSSTFVVPAAGLVPPGFAATWTGIGGYNSSDLIQAGVGENSLPSNPLLGPQYFAWYEILPAAETPISGCSGDASCTVTPGDTVSVTITDTGAGKWSVSISDAGKWTYSKSISYASSHSSAEWILEAPTLVAQTLLAPVGTVHFGPTSTYTDAGGTHPIAAGNPNQIILSPGLVNEATPSGLAGDGQSFNDCAYSQTCPTPAAGTATVLRRWTSKKRSVAGARTRHSRANR